MFTLVLMAVLVCWYVGSRREQAGANPSGTEVVLAGESVVGRGAEKIVTGLVKLFLKSRQSASAH
jgi:hypothetical protein